MFQQQLVQSAYAAPSLASEGWKRGAEEEKPRAKTKIKSGGKAKIQSQTKYR
jgi:hypothetical protein